MDEESPEQRKLFRGTSVQYAHESGMDDSRMAASGVSFLLRLVNPLVLDRTGCLASGYSSENGIHELGGTVRQRAGQTQGKQKSLFGWRKTEERDKAQLTVYLIYCNTISKI